MLSNKIQYFCRDIKHGEMDAVRKLVIETFKISIFPECKNPEALRKMEFYMSTHEMINRLNKGFSINVAVINEAVAGVIEVYFDYIAIFFIDPNHQFKGIGRALLSYTLKKNFINNNVTLIRVNSSLGAINFYKKFNFKVVGPSRETNGTPSVPMQLNVLEPVHY